MKTMITDAQIAILHEKFNYTSATVRRKDFVNAGIALGFENAQLQETIVGRFSRAAVRGHYYFPSIGAAPAASPAEPATPVASAKINNACSVTSVSNDEIYIPSVDPTYVKWGEFKTVLQVINSNQFFPLFISGMSGNGKTFMVEQACAKGKREYVRVQISPETDEDDLIGGFRLIDGETVFQKGPVIKAMERGCILLIDEIDRVTEKVMCLQGVLEGKPVLLKKTGEVITPAHGFNVIATANTKGRGSDDGRYSAAKIIDDAFLERFVAAIDQPYPTAAIETKILAKHAEKFAVEDDGFIDKLVAWSVVIRKTFEDDAIDDVVSTRRLCHILQAFSVFGNRMTAIEKCTNRFDEDTRLSFLDLYTKIDESTTLDESTALDESSAS
jgi:cobaltochelatase CobS